MTFRKSYIPFYFQPGEKRTLPFSSRDMNNAVEPKVGDYFYQGSIDVVTRIEVTEVDAEAKTYALQAKVAEIDIRKTPEYQGSFLAERERLGDAVDQLAVDVLKEFEGSFLYRLVERMLRMGK